MEKPRHDRHNNRVQKFFSTLGPGVVTGAADDDPSGISTYSSAGAQFGLGILWTVFLTFPLMAAVQTMCARLALATGEGLAYVIRKRYPAWVLFLSCALLIVANVVNIGADLAGMGESMQMVTGIHAWVWIPLFAIGLILVLVYWSYRKLALLFKWLTLVLFAYVFAAFLAKPNWWEVLRSTFIPTVAWNSGYLQMLVAILGTTITPYMFFWQAAQEVEEERAHGELRKHRHGGCTPEEIKEANRDVLTGMGWAGVAMYFIILTTAATLHKSGHTEIATAQQAAEALRPLAGNAAYLLFALGLVGTGILAVPVLAGSAAYAIAEALHWRGSLDVRPKVGRKFYAVIAIAILLGMLMSFLKIDAIRALYYAAIVNGMLAPPLVAIVTLLNSDSKVMGKYVAPKIAIILGWVTAALMFICAVAMFIA